MSDLGAEPTPKCQEMRLLINLIATSKDPSAGMTAVAKALKNLHNQSSLLVKNLDDPNHFLKTLIGHQGTSALTLEELLMSGEGGAFTKRDSTSGLDLYNLILYPLRQIHMKILK